MGDLKFNVIRLTPEQAHKEIAENPWRFGGEPTATETDYTEWTTKTTREISGHAPFAGPGDDETKNVYAGQVKYLSDANYVGTHYVDGKFVNSYLEVKVSRLLSARDPYPLPLIEGWTHLNEENEAVTTGALLGDYNHDGKTDILVQLSNGAAYVFEQTSEKTLPHPEPPRHHH